MNSQAVIDSLRSYHYDNQLLTDINQQLKDYWDCGMKGLTYDTPSLSKSNKISSSTENAAYRNMDKWDELIKAHCEQEIKVLRLLCAIDGLPPLERLVVSLKYIDNRNPSWAFVANGMQYSIAHCKLLRAKAVCHIGDRMDAWRS